MATGFTPSFLIFPKNGGTQSINYTTSLIGDETWETLYFYPEDGKLTGNITNQATTSCTVNVTASANSTNSEQSYNGVFSQNFTATRPIQNEFPIKLANVENSFVPASNSLIVPSSGGSYSVYFVTNSSTYAIDWSTQYSSEYASIENVVSGSQFYSFDLVVNETSLLENSSERIKLQYRVNGSAFLVYNFYFTILAKENQIIATPSSLAFPQSAATKTIQVSTNVSGDYEFTAEPDSSTTFVNNVSVQAISNKSANISVSTDTNTGTTRSGNVIIRYGNYSINYPISQEAYDPNAASIVIENDLYQINYPKYVGNSYFTTTGITEGTIQVSSNADWLTAIVGNNYVTFTANENITNTIRTGELTLSGLDSAGKLISDKLTVQQNGINVYQICQDSTVLYNFNNESNFIIYNINTDNSTIYSGKAYKLPNAEYIEFNVNKICYNYLNSDLPNGFSFSGNINNLYQLKDYYKTFVITDNNNNTINSYNFYNSYNYDFADFSTKINSNNNLPISQPIKYEIDKRQYFLYSLFYPYISSNQSITYVLSNSKTNESYSLPLTFGAAGGYLFVDNILLTGDYDTIEINGDTYKILDSCAEYCLYYQNSYGGWDSLLIRGNNIKTDDISQNFYNRSFNNTTIEFEKKNYLNIITSKYKFYTSYLTDEQASRMYNLIESNEVYLHNLVTGVVKPVIVTDTSLDYKTFTNQQRKKFYYEINVEESQGKIRR